MAKAMIEINEIAKDAISTISPYLAMGGQEIIKGAASDLWNKIKGVFKKKGKEKLIEEFEKSPTDLKTQGKLEYVLESELKLNNELLESITELIKTIRTTDEFSYYSKQIGNDNISLMGNISNSTIKIKK